jgi:hypothetical protein
VYATFEWLVKGCVRWSVNFDESMTPNSLRGEVRKERAEGSGFLEWWAKSKLIDNEFPASVWRVDLLLTTLRRVSQVLYSNVLSLEVRK